MAKRTEADRRDVPPLVRSETLAAAAASGDGEGAAARDRANPFAATRCVCVEHGQARGVLVGRSHVRP